MGVLNAFMGTVALWSGLLLILAWVAAEASLLLDSHNQQLKQY